MVLIVIFDEKQREKYASLEISKISAVDNCIVSVI